MRAIFSDKLLHFVKVEACLQLMALSTRAPKEAHFHVHSVYYHFCKIYRLIIKICGLQYCSENFGL